MSQKPRKITVECHGALVDKLGDDSVTIKLGPPYTVIELLSLICDQWPEAEPLITRTACARGDQLITEETVLGHEDTVVLIPPVSGGRPDNDNASDAPYLSEAPLDLEALMDETEDDRSGALVVFGGTVRLNNDGREVDSMDYSSYGPLAARTMGEIEQETRRDFDIHACRLQHRTGRLKLGEVSVYVVVRAKHRDSAFEAARHALDQLKARVAVWKNEFYTDGSSAYLEGTAIPRPERP